MTEQCKDFAVLAPPPSCWGRRAPEPAKGARIFGFGHVMIVMPRVGRWSVFLPPRLREGSRRKRNGAGGGYENPGGRATTLPGVAALVALGYYSWRYPKNSSSLSTFSCLTNTVSR
jgi:hypothetical protein